MRSSTETIIAALRILAADIQSPDGVANSAIREAADRLEELSKAQGEPVAWFEQSDSGEWFLAYSFNQNANTKPLYAAPPDQSARIAELENSESFLKECVDLAIKDREYYENESKSRLEGLLGATEANRVSLGRIAELEQQIKAMQAKRQPLRDSDIERMILNWDDIDEEMDLIDFARAIEKAHGIE